MPEETPTYDLTLLLSTNLESEQRAKIVADVEAAISTADGSLVHKAEWGTRPMAYRIRHQADAEYHLLQFTGPTSLLENLHHTLSITDGVLRFRIIKVLPGTPAPPAPERIAVPAAAPAPAAPAAPAAPTATVPAETATAPTETATAPTETATAPTETATAPAERTTVPAGTDTVPAEAPAALEDERDSEPTE